MEAIKTQVEFVVINAEVDANPIGGLMAELDELKLALVGGGMGDVFF